MNIQILIHLHHIFKRKKIINSYSTKKIMQISEIDNSSQSCHSRISKIDNKIISENALKI